MNLIIDAIGWFGAVNVLVAYLLISIHKVRGDSLLYQVLNIVGALGLVVNTAFHHAYPSAIVNIIWIGIGFYSLYRGYTFRRIRT